ncbi:hypothetical protein IFM89_003754 [Coptis chinensis]|uniref:Uncharacterized protein n=1 Tax=Coptis chinensis TaxID=261450 RepID=A0A835M3K9_9MAGN|nr:hypothetical protein IFM89_003754 [Coptis chinensis]
MDATKKPKFLCCGENQYIVFDRSYDIVTTTYPNLETDLSDSNNVKCKGIGALEEAKAGRSNGVVVEIINSESSELSFDQDLDLKSDAGTSCHDLMDVDDNISDDELSRYELCDGCEVDSMYEESVKKKLELLAGMVGIDCSNPGVVLAEVVRILQGLTENTCCEEI